MMIGIVGTVEVPVVTATEIAIVVGDPIIVVEVEMTTEVVAETAH